MQIIEFKNKYTEQIKNLIHSILQEMKTPFGSELEGDPDLDQILQIYKGNSRFWIAVENGEVLGTVAIKKFSRDTAILKRMFVKISMHGKGVGQSLLDYALKFAGEQGYKNIILNTHETMVRAQKFYEKNGFIKIGEHQGSYRYKKELK